MVNIAICDDSPEYGEILEYKIRQCMQELNIEYSLYYFEKLESLQEKALIVSMDILFLDIMINSKNSAEWVAEHQKTSMLR